MNRFNENQSEPDGAEGVRSARAAQRWWTKVLLCVTATLIVAAAWFALQGGAPIIVGVPKPTRGASFDAAALRAIIGQRRPSFTLGTLAGEATRIERFDGDVVVLNFWATWCEPCIDEIPMLVELSRQYAGRGVQVVGVAIDDLESVKTFVRAAGVHYPVLVDSRNGFELVADYGNPRRSLPYTVFIDRQGIIRAAHLGTLTRGQAEAKLEPLL